MLVVQNVSIHAVTSSSKRILAVVMKKVLETPKEGRTKVSVGKDDVKEENRYWKQECHVTKNSIHHKAVNLNFNTLPLCITSTTDKSVVNRTVKISLI